MDATRTRVIPLLALTLAGVLAGGCHTLGVRKQPIAPAPVPRELDLVCLPDYRVEPPDILLIEAVRTIPRPPYRVEPLDVLAIQLANPFPDEPLTGLFAVDPDGTINVGPTYGGAVPVAGLTLPQVKAALERRIAEASKLKEPLVTVTLAQSRAAQRISGPHLVRPDGSIALGTYGSVRVAGLTLAEVRRAIEAHLAEFLLDPQVSVDVQNYNSKLYYVILDGGGAGQTVARLPVTGKDTVIDAIAQVSGLSAVSSKDRIWVSRPAPAGCGHQILPVDWRAVSECGDTATNYQLMPGDRVFVAAYPLVTADTQLARIISPIERLLGVTLLGSSTVNSIRTDPNLGFGGTTGTGQ
jgi:polysaccharide export outer membrane protein